MTTFNIAITKNWTKIADDTDSELLATWATPVVIEVATTASNTAPTVIGHHLSSDSAITRGVLGVGFVWAKTSVGAKPTDIILIVTK